MENINKQKILVVEDDHVLAHAILRKLDVLNFEAVNAKSVDEALEKLNSNEDIAAIWIDHYLIGKTDGLDLVSKVKGDEKWKMLPIFVVSNTATKDKIQSYLHLGVTKYYVKSNCRLDDIISDIQAAIA